MFFIFEREKSKKFFVDTANPGEIKKACQTGVMDGVTTNPTLISKENRDFASLIKEICDIIRGLPISLEVLSPHADGMVEEARKLSKMGENIVVKRFARFEKGEGIEKRKDDFANEVMSQIKG